MTKSGIKYITFLCQQGPSSPEGVHLAQNMFESSNLFLRPFGHSRLEGVHLDQKYVSVKSTPLCVHRVLLVWKASLWVGRFLKKNEYEISVSTGTL